MSVYFLLWALLLPINVDLEEWPIPGCSNSRSFGFLLILGFDVLLAKAAFLTTGMGKNILITYKRLIFVVDTND